MELRKFVACAIDNLKALSSFRKIFSALSLVAIPTLIAIGFGVQAVNVVNESGRAILFFAAASVNATVFFWFWEEVLEFNPKTRIISITIVGVLVLFFFYCGAAWAADRAQDAADESIRRDAHESVSEIRSEKIYSHLQEQSAPTIEAKREEPKLKPQLPKKTPPVASQPSTDAQALPPSKPGIFTITQTSKPSTRADAAIETEVVIQTTQQFPTLKLALECDKAIVSGGSTTSGALMGLKFGIVSGHPNIFLYSYQGAVPPFGPANPLVLNLWSKEEIKCKNVATF